ncbi:glycosyltransferase [Neobacillus jeddahensis]|uniref:glycosyltransferase n=1 Tax=Neobacillus jeddahensis TaxID=1461580 RepID=UPI000591677C|nr:glycosyltransferase [Neobacillus jeddahensis]
MKLMAVMVLYKQAVEESRTFQTLRKTLFSKTDFSHELEMVIYDNSPEKQVLPSFDHEGISIQYIHDPRNLGIAVAYNFAWSKAAKSGSDWLLLLDHDTQLTNEYILELQNLPELESDVAALVPKIISNGTMISPVYSGYLRPLKEEQPPTGLQDVPVMAINSGSLIRMEFLERIGGFNGQFPLDYLDHWLFYAIYANHHKVWVLDVVLEHDLSVMDYSQVSLDRYKSILDAEINFYKNYKLGLYPSYRKQLAMRLVKQVLLVKNKKIAMYTLSKLLNRKRR